MIENDYEVVVADTREMRRIHHRLRYQVYCLETGYEDPAAFPDGMERDEWDEYSIPFLVRHRPSGEWIGTMRLIPSLDGRLPIFNLMGCAPGADHAGGAGAWEISRVCIPSVYRRKAERRVIGNAGWGWRRGVDQGGAPRGFRRDDGVIRGMKIRPQYSWSGGADSGECMDVRARRGLQDFAFDDAPENTSKLADAKVDSNAVISKLFHVAASVVAKRGGEALYFLVRPSLARLMHRLQIPIERIGQACEHRGARFPYRAGIGVSRSSGVSALRYCN
ncbi:hypothetical protein M911_13930 [Ectothiorhodospira haloalkaliphila]|uniref:PEP-CTERM/exosortase system-associated acyltransferase n=1 Tax=Ectothiorhodospira haloalkaliphila TaxID=421628 RepID=W8KNN6_9GAMM|nr:GNAT family N-acyltransferase [Ectothiorhodospira haloalkaliphila]AHK80773.1 hypothetical protein M911_13930 [Ectothiorhodospira haloalkaliphila]